MEITRHFVDVGSRRVHYRRAGKGPPLLMAHQSPRSSAEYEPLMREWGKHFTCIAPDTPGFGQSDPLAIEEPTIDDFADAMLAFLRQSVASGFMGEWQLELLTVGADLEPLLAKLVETARTSPRGVDTSEI